MVGCMSGGSCERRKVFERHRDEVGPNLHAKAKFIKFKVTCFVQYSSGRSFSPCTTQLRVILPARVSPVLKAYYISHLPKE